MSESMSLTSRLSGYVAHTPRQRGGKLFQRGQVGILRGDDTDVIATVDRAQQEVSLSRKRDTVMVSCSCSNYQARFRTCKHIWATLLAAEAQGHLLGPDHTLPSYIVEEDADEFHRSAEF